MTPSSSAVLAAITISTIVNARGAAAASTRSCSERISASARFGSTVLAAAREAAASSIGGTDVRTTNVIASTAGHTSRVANIGTYIFGAGRVSPSEKVGVVLTTPTIVNQRFAL